MIYIVMPNDWKYNYCNNSESRRVNNFEQKVQQCSGSRQLHAEA